jgi:RNA polymerase subunit RPABC4/transcription elongation factor Spt4
VKNKTCKDCKYFLGGGDWDLCCENPPASAKESWCGFLCYEDTPACENFKPLRRIKLKPDSGNWDSVESPLHTGRHSQ